MEPEYQQQGQNQQDQDKKRARAKQFMNVLERLPRLCSPTICGTLSQPTTRAERTSRGVDKFEWSLEQRAILSPANITTDTDATDDWQHLADLKDQTWLQQESENFFSQRTIAPSPMVTPSTRRPIIDMTIEEDEDEDEDDDVDIEEDDNEDTEEQEDDDQEFLDERNLPDEDDDEDTEEYSDLECDGMGRGAGEQDMDNLFFSPQPLRSSQTQQRVDIFSPETFVRVMEDESTLQSTPKTYGGSQQTRTRTRTRSEMSD